MLLPFLIAMVAGWLQRHQQQVITYLYEENRILKAQLGGRRLRLTDTERRRLAALAHPIGRTRLKVLVVMELSTRSVQIAGITPHPTDAFMAQCARQLTDPFEGFLLDKRYLLHDRDEKFVYGFDQIRRASGVEPVLLPPRSPNLNAYCERFVRSLREEVLDQMIVIGEGSLRYVIQS